MRPLRPPKAGPYLEPHEGGALGEDPTTPGKLSGGLSLGQHLSYNLTGDFEAELPLPNPSLSKTALSQVGKKPLTNAVASVTVSS